MTEKVFDTWNETVRFFEAEFLSKEISFHVRHIGDKFGVFPHSDLIPTEVNIYHVSWKHNGIVGIGEYVIAKTLDEAKEKAIIAVNQAIDNHPYHSKHTKHIDKRSIKVYDTNEACLWIEDMITLDDLIQPKNFFGLWAEK